MNRDDYRQLLLSGTVTFPATFPQLGSISLCSEPVPCGLGGQNQRMQDMLVVHEFPSARVTIARKLFAEKVRAIFLPQDPNRVNYGCGTWLLDQEIAAHLRSVGQVLGIVFVPETESTLLEVRAGLTAGESAQYYPPLPCDRSYNHYAGHPKQRHMMSCDGCDDSQETCGTPLASTFRSLAVGDGINLSCDGHDDMLPESFSCDGSEPLSDS